jgi:superfamily I DNA/RNA helicase
LALQIIQSSLGEVAIFGSDARQALLSDLVEQEIRAFPDLGRKSVAEKSFIFERIAKGISLAKTLRQEPTKLNQNSLSETEQKLLQKVYLEYQAYMAEHELLDLDDLVPTATGLLEENPKLVRLPGVGVQQVILDETQDTAKGQLDFLIKLLQISERELKIQPTLLAVGDEKQQIFLSQTKASPYAYLKQHFPQAVPKHLAIQYRYGPTHNQIAGQISWRLGFEEKIIPARKQDDPQNRFSNFLDAKLKTGDLPVGIYQAGNDQVEFDFVATEIERIRKYEPFASVGVLVRRRIDSERIAQLLFKRGIPHWVKGTKSEAHHENNLASVTISTVHSAKGAEFDVVFVLGLAQGIFPINPKQIMAELKLFFVAVTRARYLAYLSYPSERIEGNKRVKLAPSSFLSLLENSG